MRSNVKQERLENLESLFDDWGIDHFAPSETIELTHPDWPFDSLYPPPVRMQENIRKTIILADKIRKDFGHPIFCISGYRPAPYNELIDGSSDSQHLEYYALDLKPADSSKFTSFRNTVQKKVEEARSYGNIVGRGFYDTFIHIDTGFYDYQRNWDNRT